MALLMGEMGLRITYDRSLSFCVMVRFQWRIVYPCLSMLPLSCSLMIPWRVVVYYDLIWNLAILIRLLKSCTEVPFQSSIAPRFSVLEAISHKRIHISLNWLVLQFLYRTWNQGWCIGFLDTFSRRDQSLYLEAVNHQPHAWEAEFTQVIRWWCWYSEREAAKDHKCIPLLLEQHQILATLDRRRIEVLVNEQTQIPDYFLQGNCEFM